MTIKSRLQKLEHALGIFSGRREVRIVWVDIEPKCMATKSHPERYFSFLPVTYHGREHDKGMVLPDLINDWARRGDIVIVIADPTQAGGSTLPFGDWPDAKKYLDAGQFVVWQEYQRFSTWHKWCEIHNVTPLRPDSDYSKKDGKTWLKIELRGPYPTKKRSGAHLTAWHKMKRHERFKTLIMP